MQTSGTHHHIEVENDGAIRTIDGDSNNEIGLAEEPAAFNEKDVSPSDPSSCYDEKAVGNDPTAFYDMKATDLVEESHVGHDSGNFAVSTLPHQSTHSGQQDGSNNLLETTLENPAASSMDSSKSDSKESESPEFDAITREAGLVLDEKLQRVRGLCKTLLNEITVYVQASAKTQAEYLRIQRLEHQESSRLDQVEPDVKGATSHVLEQPFFGAAGSMDNKENK